jgi:hypothetical protein
VGDAANKTGGARDGDWMSTKTPNKIVHRSDGTTVLVLERKDGTFKQCIIDTADYEIIRGHRWAAAEGRRRKTWYAITNIRKNGKQTSVKIHSLLFPDAQTVDHKDWDGLNNRRSNLRPASQREQKIHQRKASERRLFKGVQQLPSGRYRATIKPNGKLIHLGVFDTAEQAARIYDGAARENYGEFAALNFPEQVVSA